MNLSLLILLPILTALAVLLMRDTKQVRVIALMGSVLQLALVGWLTLAYVNARNAGVAEQFLFEQRMSWFNAFNIQYYAGVDGISVAMIMMTALVVVAGVLVSWKVEKLTKEFFFLLLFLSAGAYGFFVSLDLFMMFFFLELAVIPKFLLIAIWGSGRKEYSANKLALMLMGGSALVFVGLLAVYFYNGSPTFDLVALSKAHLPVEVQSKFFPFLFLGFGVFGALFPFHTWVPDGHSSAPTAASMFLAGISMKLGGYGCLRVATYLMPEGAVEYQSVIILLSAVAILYGAFATLMQTDLKYINAYSSVSHCGFVLLGIGMLTKTAITGAVMQMVSHGLMTALFFAAIGMLYERTHTRMVAQMGGLLKLTPFIGTVFFIAGLCSLGLPGFSGFAAEMTVFMGAWQNPNFWYRAATIAACASIVVTAVYILRALGKVMWGELHVGSPKSEVGSETAGITSDLGPRTSDVAFGDAEWNEKLAAVILIAGVVVMGVAPILIQNLLSPASEEVMKNVLRAEF
ncbi:MAG: NADH-quinone oxidoreductase subunit M [Chitinophagales bacterium]|nr:NADH-quinone oxidoreductase subunit M [Chitinophagales bacterium]